VPDAAAERTQRSFSIAELQSVKNRASQDYLVQIGAKVPYEVADAIRNLADAGDRSISREIRRAVEAHLERSGELSSSRSPVPRTERRETHNLRGQSSSPAPAGQGR
jgi:hypothetical protein